MDIRANIQTILPERMLSRPVDHRGYPVPWFVTLKDDQGRWDFRPVDPHRLVEAIRKKLCWICGHKLGRHKAFAVGPMCGVNRISGEPPQHLKCAEFAAQACPFLILPKSKRRTANLPEGVTENPGALKRNPGVVLVWSTTTFHVVRNNPGVLFQMGEPTDISFWAEGRTASREEIDESITSGLPALSDLAAAEGPDAMAALTAMVARFTKLLPSPHAPVPS